MHKIVRGHLEKLPGAMVPEQGAGAEDIKRCVYSRHSLRATTATLLLDAGADICNVQELLGHRHVTTTQIYDERRRADSDVVFWNCLSRCQKPTA